MWSRREGLELCCRSPCLAFPHWSQERRSSLCGVSRYGLPQPHAQTLLEKLTSKGFGPDEAVLCFTGKPSPSPNPHPNPHPNPDPDEAILCFTGALTNRCVSSSLLPAPPTPNNALISSSSSVAAS